jgi:hypothetical protein
VSEKEAAGWRTGICEMPMSTISDWPSICLPWDTDVGNDCVYQLWRQSEDGHCDKEGGKGEYQMLWQEARRVSTMPKIVVASTAPQSIMKPVSHNVFWLRGVAMSRLAVCCA